MSMHSRAGFTAALYRLRSPCGALFSGWNRTARALRECVGQSLRNGCPNAAEPCCREAMESVFGTEGGRLCSECWACCQGVMESGWCS
jgi:hypothetical protein